MSLTVPTLDELAADPARAREIPPEAVPPLLGELERLKATLWARLMVPGNANMNGSPEATREEGDKLLTPEETAERLGVTVAWLYRHAKRLPFTRRLSRKCLRFSETALGKWQATKRA